MYFTLFLILSEYVSQIDPAPRYRIFDSINKFFANFSFWTVQTNLMFYIFFIFVALDGKWGVWKPNARAWIYFLSYMTLTMALFWVALVGVISEKDIYKNPLNVYSNDYDTFLKWFITCNTHLYTFAFSLIFFIVIVKKQHINENNWYKKNLLIGWWYPLFYVLFVLLRMITMSQLGLEYFVNENLDFSKAPTWINEDFVTVELLAAPYFFFNWNVAHGNQMVLWGAIGCLLLISSVQYMWLKVSNYIVNRQFKIYENKPKFFQRLTIFELVLELIKICAALIAIAYLIKIIFINGNLLFIDENLKMYDSIFVFYTIMAIGLSLLIIGLSLSFIIFNTRKYNLATIVNLILSGFLIICYMVPILLISSMIGSNYFNKNELKNI
ncbi:hypothetical protein [Spiroplasma culicicola]|uniref:hypothetical protein n=1 Tax=Spiroplasma culicicola TaxID=216935 RepID=UPI00046CCD87|nr:hypothetical protein [Spiroplasma culicicola]